MKHKAIKELRELLRIKDWTEFCPEKDREDALNLWIDKWLIEVDQSQFVVDSKYLDSEHVDFVKYRMGQILGDALTEECVSYTIDKKKISATMVGLKRGKY